MKKYSIVTLLGGILVLLLSFFLQNDVPFSSAHVPTVPAEATSTDSSAIAEPKKDAYTWYRVERVIDGDTLVLSINGVDTRVRLIGLDTPEVVDPRKTVQCFGREASNEARRILEGEEVRLAYDRSQGETDRYGRLLAYIYLKDGTLFNKYMIAAGFGHEYTYRLPYRYQGEFKAAERAAREAGVGLWAPEACSR